MQFSIISKRGSMAPVAGKGIFFRGIPDLVIGYYHYRKWCKTDIWKDCWVNYPNTTKYYERFFEIIKKPTHSVYNRNGLSFESRIPKGEKEVSKRRADIFFRLRPGEFVAFANGKDRKLRFTLQKIERSMPKGRVVYSDEELKLVHEVLC